MSLTLAMPLRMGSALVSDGRTVYVADQRQWQIMALDYDPDKGTTSNRRIFARIPKDEGQCPMG